MTYRPRRRRPTARPRILPNTACTAILAATEDCGYNSDIPTAAAYPVDSCPRSQVTRRHVRERLIKRQFSAVIAGTGGRGGIIRTRIIIIEKKNDTSKNDEKRPQRFGRRIYVLF